MPPRSSPVLLALLPVMLSTAACGAEPVSYSDGEIADGLALQEDRRGYLVATKEQPSGDPFCRITDLLNDNDEVLKVGEEAEGQAISSGEGNTGVVVETPFGCEEDVQRNLNRLDSAPREE